MVQEVASTFDSGTNLGSLHGCGVWNWSWRAMLAEGPPSRKNIAGLARYSSRQPESGNQCSMWRAIREKVPQIAAPDIAS
jgi:hypothetical protein